MSTALSTRAATYITENPQWKWLSDDAESRYTYLSTLDKAQCKAISDASQILRGESGLLWDRASGAHSRGLLISDYYGASGQPERHAVWAGQFQRDAVGVLMGEYLRKTGDNDRSSTFATKLEEAQRLAKLVFPKDRPN